MRRRAVLATIAAATAGGCVDSTASHDAAQSDDAETATDSADSDNSLDLEISEWVDDVRGESTPYSAIHAYSDRPVQLTQIVGVFADGSTDTGASPDLWDRYPNGDDPLYWDDDAVDDYGDLADELEGWIVFYPDEGDPALEGVDVQTENGWERIDRPDQAE